MPRMIEKRDPVLYLVSHILSSLGTEAIFLATLCETVEQYFHGSTVSGALASRLHGAGPG